MPRWAEEREVRRGMQYKCLHFHFCDIAVLLKTDPRFCNGRAGILLKTN